MAKKKSITQKTLVELYMDYVLEHNHAPKSIYSFSKHNGFEEAEFYTFFGNFESLEKSIFTQFFTNTIKTLESSKDYSTYDSRNQLLSFYSVSYTHLTLPTSDLV